MPTGLNNAIKANSATAAFFQGASRAVVEDDAEEVDNRNKTIVDTLFGLSSFIPGPRWGSFPDLEGHVVLRQGHDQAHCAERGDAGFY